MKLQNIGKMEITGTKRKINTIDKKETVLIIIFEYNHFIRNNLLTL